MSDRNEARQQDDFRRPSRGAGDGDDRPLADFPWSDGVVGMGFLPHEVGLPQGWSWASSRVRR
jgi:hypothetical protein